MKVLLAAALLAMAATNASADEAQIRKVVGEKLGVKVEGVQPGPLGLYEVRYKSRDGMRIVYTDANATHIIVGKIYEAASERDLTEERMRKLNAIKFESLPLDQAVKIQRGNGKRVVAMFSDPYCPYCKAFEKTLQQVDDITIYVFMFPVIHPELADQSKAVWCSPDRAKAWLDVALRGKPPTAPSTCANPVDKNLQLGRSIGVNSTPTLVLFSGERVSGALSKEDLADLLDAKP
ncbi:MAG TPA: DsbC family protein [Burkholderiales bacterium]|nr:DsbC family protein [Burkholderiales bacterium]